MSVPRLVTMNPSTRCLPAGRTRNLGRVHVEHDPLREIEGFWTGLQAAAGVFAEGARHQVGPNMVADMLESAGRDVRFLGLTRRRQDRSHRSWIHGLQKRTDGQVLVQQWPMNSVARWRQFRAASLEPTCKGQREGALLPRNAIRAVAGRDRERIWCRRDRSGEDRHGLTSR